MYDVIIIGGGPAGLTAGLYCARAALSVLIIEARPYEGGQLTLTDSIKNFPSYDSIGGAELALKMGAHAAGAGASFLNASAVRVTAEKGFLVETDKGVYAARAVIYAAGSRHRRLDVKGEKRLTGKGVSYCAVCDGSLYRGKSAVVVGGGNTALGEALYLSKLCSDVTLIHRRDSFRGSPSLLEKCRGADNIRILTSSCITEILGEDRVRGVVVRCRETETEIKCSAVFAAVGMEPVTEPVMGICSLDETGYIIAGEDCASSLEGLFAAGDVRRKMLRQIITACSDGANAAASAEKYLSS